MSASVYVAMPLSEAGSARALADRLRFAGFGVTSRWHDDVAPAGAVDPHTRQARRHCLYENLRDLERANVLVANTCLGVPGATLGELAYALAIGRRVIWVQPPSRRADGVRHSNIFDAHDAVDVVVDAEAVIPALHRVAAERLSERVGAAS